MPSLYLMLSGRSWNCTSLSFPSPQPRPSNTGPIQPVCEQDLCALVSWAVSLSLSRPQVPPHPIKEVQQGPFPTQPCHLAAGVLREPWAWRLGPQADKQIPTSGNWTFPQQHE